eukprot:TRINITY_DN3437_c0_g1_i1.p1 TRINITY_DN3437_c0_g1~~TRINITY_DN3437_c0_g1_i1.p1  ORF type:complete len:180 (-),score=3.04 TRINITY_DN3437_c0_g1_i1:527-1066(-)
MISEQKRGRGRKDRTAVGARWRLRARGFDDLVADLHERPFRVRGVDTRPGPAVRMVPQSLLPLPVRADADDRRRLPVRGVSDAVPVGEGGVAVARLVRDVERLNGRVSHPGVVDESLPRSTGYEGSELGANLPDELPQDLEDPHHLVGREGRVVCVVGHGDADVPIRVQIQTAKDLVPL